MSDTLGRSRHKPPERVGPYRIEDRLGRGGMGEVYRALDERLGRRVAIKQILPEAAGSRKAWERLRREARTVASLNHPSIVQIFDVIEERGGDWIVMELVEGTTLRRLIREGELDLGQALQLAREIAEGLAEAHGKGVVHRDLKTENVMITEAGRAKILDFGLAKRMVWQEDDDQSLSVKGAILGTGRAMSPEQAMGGEIDHRSDLFSLGSLFFELFTGQPPFRGSSFIYTLAQVCTYEPPLLAELNPEVPDELSALTEGLLAKNPDHRPQSASEVVATLATIVGSTVFEPGGPSLFDSVDLEPLKRTSAPSAEPGHSRQAYLSRAPGSRATTAGFFVKTLLAVELLGREELLTGGKDAFEMLRKHERLTRDLLTRFESLEIRLEETLLLLFERPIDAVRYAQAYFDALAGLTAPEGGPVRARAGIHLGEIFLRRSTPEEISKGANPVEVEGRAELLTYQVMSLGRPGEILLSQGVFELARRAVMGDKSLDHGLRWEAHGRYRFAELGETVQIFEVGREGSQSLGPPPSTPGVKFLGGLDEPVWRARRRFLGALAATVVVALVAWFLSSGADVPPRTPSVVVLGFEDMSSDSSYRWLSIALEERLRSYLAAGPQIRVVTARDTVRARRELSLLEIDTLADDTLERVGRNLGVDFVLAGSYVVVEDSHGVRRLSFVPRLQGVGGVEFGLASVTLEVTDLAGLVAQAGREVRRRLGADEISSREAKGLRFVLPTSPAASRFYCEGLKSFRRYELFSARSQLERAIEHEPSFALAHAALAEVFEVRGDRLAARRSLEQAHALGSRLPSEVSLRLEARLRRASGDWAQAISKYRILLRFLPWYLDDGLRLVEAQISAGANAAAAATVEQMRSWGPGVGEDARVELAAVAVAAAASDAEAQLDAARRAVGKAQGQGATVLLGRARRAEAQALLALGRRGEARAVLLEAERSFRQTGERPELAEVLFDLSQLETEDSTAQALLAEVRRIYRELGHVRAEWRTEQGGEL